MPKTLHPRHTPRLCPAAGCLTIYYGTGRYCPKHTAPDFATPTMSDPRAAWRQTRRDRIIHAVQRRLTDHPPLAPETWLPMPHSTQARKLRLAEWAEFQFRWIEHVAELKDRGEDYEKGFGLPNATAVGIVWDVLATDCHIREPWTKFTAGTPRPHDLDHDDRERLEFLIKQAVVLVVGCALRSLRDGHPLTFEAVFVTLAESFSPWWRHALERAGADVFHADQVLPETIRNARRDLVCRQIDPVALYDLVTKTLSAGPNAPYTAVLIPSEEGGYVLTAHTVAGLDGKEEVPTLRRLKNAYTYHFGYTWLRQSIALYKAGKIDQARTDRVKWAGERGFNRVTPATAGHHVLYTLGQGVLVFNASAFIHGYDAALAQQTQARDELAQKYGVQTALIPRLKFGPRRGMAWKHAKLVIAGRADLVGHTKKIKALHLPPLPPDIREDISRLLATHDRAEKALLAFGQVAGEARPEYERHIRECQILGRPLTPCYIQIRSPHDLAINQRTEPVHLWPVRVTPKKLRDDDAMGPVEHSAGEFDFRAGLRFNFFQAPGLDGTGTQPLVGVDVRSSQYQLLSILLNLPKLEEIACTGRLWHYLTEEIQAHGLLAPTAYTGPEGRAKLLKRNKLQATRVGYGSTLARALRTLWKERDELGPGFSTEGAEELAFPRVDGEDDAAWSARLEGLREKALTYLTAADDPDAYWTKMSKARQEVSLDLAEYYEEHVFPDGPGIRQFREACREISRIAMKQDPYRGFVFQDPYDPEQIVRWHEPQRALVNVSVSGHGLDRVQIPPRRGFVTSKVQRREMSIPTRPPGKWVTTPAGKERLQKLKLQHGEDPDARMSAAVSKEWGRLKQREGAKKGWRAFEPNAPASADQPYAGDYPVDINALRRTLAPSLTHTADALFSKLVVMELRRLGISTIVDLRDSWLVPERVILAGETEPRLGVEVLEDVVVRMGEPWLLALGPLYDGMDAYLSTHRPKRNRKGKPKEPDWAAYSRQLRDAWLKRIEECEAGARSYPRFFTKRVDPTA